MDKISYLADANVFVRLMVDEETGVTSITRSMACEANQVVYDPGQDREVLFLLENGRVEVYRLLKDGQRRKVTTLSAGATFGQMPLVGYQMDGAFATTTEPSTLRTIERSDLEQFILNDPKVALRVIRILGDVLMETKSRLEDFASKGLRGRLAAMLLRLAARRGLSTVEGLTHQKLADLLATYRETVTQTLNAFRVAGLIKIGRKRLELLNTEGLRDVAEGRRLTGRRRSRRLPDE